MMTSAVIWSIPSMERHVSDGVVYTAHWTASLSKDGESASVYGSVGLSEPDPENFIEYKDLTEQDVIEWVKNVFGDEQVASIEKNLAEQIQVKLKPKTASGVPW